MNSTLRAVRRGLLLGVLLMLAFAAVSHAATLMVTTTKDSKDKSCTKKKCSLRDAVTFAKAGDTVVLTASKTPYMVTLGEIKIGVAPLTISGAGATKSVIQSNGKGRVFEVTAAPGSSSTVTFKGVTVSGGHATSMPGGGGILVDFVSGMVGVNLTLVRSAVTGNSVAVSTGASLCCGGGGGIYSNGGSVTLKHSTVSGNKAKVVGSSTLGASYGDGGGGVYDNDLVGAVTVVASTLAHNSATVTKDQCCNGGGAIYGNAVSGASISISAKSKLTGNSFTLKGTKTDVSSSNNCCSGGGAVYQDYSGPVKISHSTVTANKASVSSGDCCHGGGGVYIDDSNSTLTITDSTLKGNSATVHGPAGANSNRHCCSGGGAVATFGPEMLRASTLSGNSSSVSAGDCCQGGGAIQLDTFNKSFTARASTISGNRSVVSSGATDSGAGGVYEDGGGSGTLTFTNSTISGNSTNAANSLNGGGGGLYLNSTFALQPTILANVTVAGNAVSSGAGGGIANFGSLLQAKDSIVAINTAKHGANCAGFSSPMFTSLGYNLTTPPDTCNFIGTGDKVVKASAVKLGPLANNGGPTMTRALLKGSPAIDHGNPAGCTDPLGATLKTDQRGKPRPDRSETICDIGAYEYQDKSLR
jgi:CSLREA domain-containing protein